MPLFRVLRKDYYIVDFEAENEEQAQEKMRNDETLRLLNNGRLCECEIVEETLEVVEMKEVIS